MVPILNRSNLISKVCKSDNMQIWSHIVFHMVQWYVKCLHTPCRSILHIHIHICVLMDIMECGVSPPSMQIHTPYPYPYLYPYGYYGVWSVDTLHVDPYFVSISIYVSLGILQSVECLCTPCRLHSVSISIFVSIWILQSLECPHTLHRLTVYIEYTVNP